MMEENQLIDEILAPSAVNVSSNYIQVGDRFSRTIFISNYPRFLNSGWFSNVINLDQELNIAFHIHPEDTAAILKKLRDRLARLHAQAIEEQEKGRVRDPVLETAIADIEDLRDKLQLGTDRFFRFGLYVTILGKDLKELDEVEKKIRNSMEAQLISVRPATFRMKEGFTSTLPLGKDELGILSPLNTEPISSSFPFVSYDMTQDQGILYGINLHNNSLILFDRFSLENANEVVFGTSGGGKSYAVKLEILRSILFGTQIFVIDPEHEYKHVAETLGGSFIKISIASETHINPFDLPSPREDERLEDVFRSHILDLTGLMRVMLGQLSAEEESVLDEALIQTYAIKDIYPDRDFSGKEPPLMGDFQNVLENMEGAQSLVIRIKKYTEGTFSGFLNRPTNVALDNQLVVFSIRDMEDELKPIAMYLVLNFIWTRVRKELRKRILVVDEAWWLLKNEAGANFLLNTAKRARKYFLGLTTISQDVPDFINSPYGKPIVTNSALQLLTRQSPAAIESVKETFNLTEAEKLTLLASRVGHGLFFAGSNHAAVRVVASYTEDQIITSDPRQILEIQEAKKEWIKETGSQ
ncbi:MAG: conjugal transfer protein TraC [Parcubacteria group bacterium RIFCSPLOWO2_12_FULL_40_10]|nr:MAG: conjugal transfer protein TraC [Parcubacteria group bacterium RIFCSPLOWO2_12_FULL_40_10]